MALGSVRADLLASGVAQVPQVAFQMDEGRGGPWRVAAGLAMGGPKSLISRLTGSSACCLLAAGCAAAGLAAWPMTR